MGFTQVTWSGQEQSSQTQVLPVPGVWLVHFPLRSPPLLAALFLALRSPWLPVEGHEVAIAYIEQY
jgi:hypothetical protein